MFLCQFYVAKIITICNKSFDTGCTPLPFFYLITPSGAGASLTAPYYVSYGLSQMKTCVVFTQCRSFQCEAFILAQKDIINEPRCDTMYLGGIGTLNSNRVISLGTLGII